MHRTVAIATQCLRGAPVLRQPAQVLRRTERDSACERLAVVGGDLGPGDICGRLLVFLLVVSPGVPRICRCGHL